MARPVHATIDRQALRANYYAARLMVRRHQPFAKAWAVIKSNAYGHGLALCAEALADVADGFAVADLDEALWLRTHHFQQPILLLSGGFTSDEYDDIVAHTITPVVHSAGQIQPLLAACAHVNRSVNVYLKLDSGMHRLGFAGQESKKAYRQLQQSSYIDAICLMSHFADAGHERGVDKALRRFSAMTYGLSGLRSLSNSAAVVSRPQIAQDWIRPGIILYGASPFATPLSADLAFTPVMTLHSTVTAIRTIAAGERVGYDGCFVATQTSRIATIPGGYADGYPRHAPTGTPVQVGNKTVPLVGRVSMDMVTVDVSAHAELTVGSPVVFWGADLPVDRVAASAQTIGYQLLSNVAARVRRHAKP